MPSLRDRVLGRSLILALAVLVPALATPARAQDTECDAGDKEVRDLRFEGNRTFGEAQLSRYIATTPSSFGRRHFRKFGTRRCLDPDEGLKVDVGRLKAFYKDNGFYDTAVDTLVRTDRRGELTVIFLVREGLPTIVDSLTVQGLDSVRNRADIVGSLHLVPGRRFGRVSLLADQDSIITRLRNSGYPYADVFPSAKTNAALHRAEVELNVVTGPYTRFGAITVTSTPYSDRRAVQIDSPVVKHLIGLQPGEEYSDRAVTTARRTLIQTLAFEHVDLTAVRDTSVVKRDALIPVAVVLREGQMRQVDTENGWATLDCFRSSVQYTDKNFFSRADRLDIAARVSKLGYGSPTDARFTRENLCYRHALDKDQIGSSVLNYSISAAVHDPLIPGRTNRSASAYREVRSEYLAYRRTTEIGGEISAVRDLPRNTNVRGAYTLELGSTKAEPALLCGVFLRCDEEEQEQVQQTLRFAVASLSFQQRRTDNLIDPRRGTVVRAEVRGSSRWLGSDTSLAFLKGTFDAAIYKALAPRTVFAARIRLGGIGGGATANGTRLPPPQERLYAGGASSVRGYRQNELGDLVYLFTHADSLVVNDSTRTFSVRADAPTDRIIPVGGNLLVVSNFDLRLRDPFFANLQYTVFTDIGAVWTPIQGEGASLRNHLKYTPGLGARYSSAIGPIQVNVGYNPYTQPAGRAFFAPENATGGFSSLFCVSPGADRTVRRVDGTWVQDPGPCPASYEPKQSNKFIRKLTITLSIGPDF